MQAPPPQVQGHGQEERCRYRRHVNVVGLEWGGWLRLAANPCRLYVTLVGLV
jgi:hypothetical protein